MRLRFYAHEIYDAADAAMRTANLELIDVQTDQSPFRNEWYERGDRNRKQFRAQVDAVPALIRQRLQELSTDQK